MNEVFCPKDFESRVWCAQLKWSPVSVCRRVSHLFLCVLRLQGQWCEAVQNGRHGMEGHRHDLKPQAAALCSAHPDLYQISTYHLLDKQWQTYYAELSRVLEIWKVFVFLMGDTRYTILSVCRRSFSMRKIWNSFFGKLPAFRLLSNLGRGSSDQYMANYC